LFTYFFVFRKWRHTPAFLIPLNKTHGKLIPMVRPSSRLNHKRDARPYLARWHSKEWFLNLNRELFFDRHFCWIWRSFLFLKDLTENSVLLRFFLNGDEFLCIKSALKFYKFYNFTTQSAFCPVSVTVPSPFRLRLVIKSWLPRYQNGTVSKRDVTFPCISVFIIKTL